MNELICDNIIGGIFEKAFDRILNKESLYELPFNKIVKLTFANANLHNLIHNIASKSIDSVVKYLSNIHYRQHFLFTKLKKKLHVQVLLNDLQQFVHLVDIGYKIDKMCLRLAVLNNCQNILEYIISQSLIKLENELLIYCCEHNSCDMYFYLRNLGLLPNIAVFNQAVNNDCIEIIKDINTNIGVSDKIITSSFQANHTDVILYLMQVAANDKIKINQDWISYPILNANFELLYSLEKDMKIEWHYELYYSALLSGSMDMVNYIESKMPDIHYNRILDTSKTKKGQATLLLYDMIYKINNKAYFSHTMNYAIQSSSLYVVKYIHSKGYGITPSNFITAFKQGSVDILKYLSQHYDSILPFYLIHYFGMHSYLSDKFIKAKILFEHGLLPLNPPTVMSVDYYRKETTHINLILQSKDLNEENFNDIDYLMANHLHFIAEKGNKINHRLITKFRICLELNIESELTNIMLTTNSIDYQCIIDSLFLFGTIKQINLLRPHITCCCDIKIVMELICYNQLPKLCYLINNAMLLSSACVMIHSVVAMISDEYISKVFGKNGYNFINMPFEYILLSNVMPTIIEWLDNHPELMQPDEDLSKCILQLDNIDLAKRFCYNSSILPSLIIWAEESDLLEIRDYLQSKLLKN